MTDHIALILLGIVSTVLAAALIAAATAYLARRDHASAPQAIARAATAFAATLTLTAAIVDTIHALVR